MIYSAYAWTLFTIIGCRSNISSAASFGLRNWLSHSFPRFIQSGSSKMSRCDSSSSWCHEVAPYCHQEGISKYSASCYCGAVQYEVLSDPETAKLCHCRGCQKLHGAPYEWVCIFHKHNVRFVSDTDNLYFYNGDMNQGWDSSQHAQAKERVLPVKVSCQTCRSPIADEGRHMWLAYGTLFNFREQQIPESFRHQCHLFYSQRVMDLHDDKPKWSGHKDKSNLIDR